MVPHIARGPIGLKRHLAAAATGDDRRIKRHVIIDGVSKLRIRFGSLIVDKRRINKVHRAIVLYIPAYSTPPIVDR
jgi:hypothetical protein